MAKDKKKTADASAVEETKSTKKAKTDSDKPAKVSIKEDDLYGDVKDTKVFMAGWKTILTYIAHYEKKSGAEIELDIQEMYNELKKNDKLTLRELFEKAVKDSMSNAM